ncbi:hypothetical protein CTY75_14220 [Acinetobacter baumannii]|uniref:Uncharacterized protein n=1 Tax=Acinetobacter baumannii TaxID=470 RepID=A0A0C4XXL4_ACIBA|nr:hypothetical protein NG19_0067 [Acinetobacter baumannii]MDB0154288.1 hypothetical protein [Acinetobacter baumannii]MDB0198965.1 hypothetical protein [Acinetobacter baumannii]OIC30092.1 hypothetical protein A7L13_13270 [Acinetobacter baumannii]
MKDFNLIEKYLIYFFTINFQLRLLISLLFVNFTYEILQGFMGLYGLLGILASMPICIYTYDKIRKKI